MGYVRKEAARLSPVYQDIVSRCLYELRMVGYFKKSTVVRGELIPPDERDAGDLKMLPPPPEEPEQLALFAELPITDHRVFEDAIKWEFVRDFLKEATGAELVPICGAFFTRKRTSEAVHNTPEKFIAQGHGKKTAGYASVNYANGDLTIRRISQRAAQAKGHVQSVVRLTENAERNGVELPKEPDQLAQ